MRNVLKDNEKIVLLSIDVGEEEKFVEVVITNRDISYNEIYESIETYLESDEGRERETDDYIINHLISTGKVNDYVMYEYINI